MKKLFLSLSAAMLCMTPYCAFSEDAVPVLTIAGELEKARECFIRNGSSGELKSASRLVDRAEKLSFLNDQEKLALYLAEIERYARFEHDSVQEVKYVYLASNMPNASEEQKASLGRRLALMGTEQALAYPIYGELISDEMIDFRRRFFIEYADKFLSENVLAKDTPSDKAQEICFIKYQKALSKYVAKDFVSAEKLCRELLSSGVKMKDVLERDAYELLASVLMEQGRMQDAFAVCRQALDAAKNHSWRTGVASTMDFSMALEHMEKDFCELDAWQLPRYTGAKPFPTPQKAEYTEKFIPLKSVSLDLGKGIDKTSPVVRLIEAKFKRYGIEIRDDAPFRISINSVPAPLPPEKSEGYSLKVTDSGAVINGFDKAGTTWGVVSLIQVIDNRGSEPLIRVCEVYDYPVVAVRGHSGWCPHAIEFDLFSKLNYNYNQDYTFGWLCPDFRLKLARAARAAVGREYVAFGLHFCNVDRTAMGSSLAMSSERTFNLLLDLYTEYAKAGCEVGFALDDCRYPMNKLDAERYNGHAAELDTTFVNGLNKHLKKAVPSAILSFCPTYYWGPRPEQVKITYQDTSEEYYAAIRKNITPDVRIFWSGAHVCCYYKPEADYEWFRRSAGRNPLMWQNAPGPHKRLNYVADVIPWYKWQYKGCIENGGIEGYMANALMPQFGAMLTTLGEFLWRPAEYDGHEEEALERGMGMLFGEKMYSILRPGAKALSAFDKYVPSSGYPLFKGVPDDDPAEAMKNAMIAEKAWKEAVEYEPFIKVMSGHYPFMVYFARKVAEAAKDHSKLEY